MATQHPTETPARRHLRLLGWTPLRKGTLRGFATVELPIGLKIVDCPILASHGTIWAALPGKPQLDHDGRQRRDDNGKPLYAAILDWKSRELPEVFSDRVFGLIREAHPDDLA